MAQLTINQCQNCGKILAPGVTECGKCHTKHSIQPTVVNPLRFTAAEADSYKAQFTEQIAACPKDANAQFAMGLTYLGLHNYELSDEHFVKAVQLTPSNPDVYYYTALSLFHHRSVMNLSKQEMDRIEEWLNTATQMQPKRKYLILQMILRQGMSSMGINVDTDKTSPAELLVKARQTSQEEDEMYEIEQHVLITDEKTQFLLGKLSAPEQKGEEGDSPTLENALACYDNFCDMPREGDNQYGKYADLESSDARADFFRHLYLPQKPVVQSKPGFVSPFIRSIVKAVIAAVAVFIIGIVLGILGWVDTNPAHVATVEERMAVMMKDKSNSKNKAERRKLAQEKYERDMQKDSQMIRLYYSYKDEAGERHFLGASAPEEKLSQLPADALYFGMMRGWKGWVGIIFLLLPIIVWVIATIIRFVSCVQERKAIADGNHARKMQYEADIEGYQTRPSIADFKLFCSLFAGPNENSPIHKGDFVHAALRQAHITERDIQNGNGKIFFSCYFMDMDNEGKDSNNPVETLHDVVIRVCVAMRDSLVYMHGVWDSVSDDIPIFDQERLLYSQIANFRDLASYSTLEVISHSNSTLAKIIYAYGDYPSLFQYQSLDPTDAITYSTTRTSDFNEFYNSLIKMHTAACR